MSDNVKGGFRQAIRLFLLMVFPVLIFSGLISFSAISLDWPAVAIFIVLYIVLYFWAMGRSQRKLGGI